MAVSIRELSKACGLSVATVSKALNGYGDISAQSKELVLRTARELGYYPNSLARALKTGRTLNLGVLFDSEDDSGLAHNYFISILNSFKVEAERRGYDITFINHNIGLSAMTYLEHCRYRNVDGAFLACTDFFSPESEELVLSDLPTVTVDHSFADRACILSENRGGVRMLVKYIAGFGHRRIAFIHGARSAVAQARLDSFREIMAELTLPLPDSYLVEGVYHNPSVTRAAVEGLLGLPDPPTCILMPDDYAALGGMEAIRTSGLRIPEDISIAGYDGIGLTQLFSPRLTSIKQDTLRIGREAARLLVHLIERPRTTHPETIVIESTLLPGETVGPVPL